MSKQRIVELQKSLKIAREVLEQIKHGTCCPEQAAENALDRMWKLEPKQELQNICGHGKLGTRHGRI